MFLTQWMSMASTIPALQCRHFIVERSINNLYNNSQGFLAQSLDFTLVWRKLGGVLHSEGLKNIWPCFLLISIGKQIYRFSFNSFYFYMKFQKFVRSRLKRDQDSGEFYFTREFYQGSLSKHCTVSRYHLLLGVLMGTGKFQGNPVPCSNLLLGNYHALVQAEFPEGAIPYNEMYCSEDPSPERGTLLKGKLFQRVQS